MRASSLCIKHLFLVFYNEVLLIVDRLKLQPLASNTKFKFTVLELQSNAINLIGSIMIQPNKLKQRHVIFGAPLAYLLQ